MKTKPDKVFTNLPLIISVVALGVSVYSVMLSSESHYIKKTETMIGKRYEVLLLMKQIIDLENKQYDIVQEIVWTYEDNAKLLDKEKDRYSHWKEKRKRIDDEILKDQERQDKFLKDKENNNIVLLETYLGHYKVILSYEVSANDHAKWYLDELKKRLAKETKQKPKATADSSR